MNRVACAALLSTFLALSAAGQSVNWSQGIVYEYDGSGNVKKIGTDTYVYDTGQRLIRGSVAGSQQSYSYDSFGNRTGCQSGAGADCQYGLTILSTNRVAGRTYDKRGNMLQLPEGNTLDYDELGMVRKEIGNQRQAYFIYTADDERIAVYDADTQYNSHTWRWTVRGLDKKPLRELTSETSSGTVNFKWTKDQIWRDSILLASRQLDPTASGGVSTYHYHVDHLGTPRQVTSSSAIIIGRHDYLPFGPEVSGNPSEPQPQTLKFTGHERDFVRDRPALDYMHARYYESRLGRFLSVDPSGWDLRRPQSWNRYSYVLNNPVNLTDPTGRCVWDICVGEATAAVVVLTTATAYVLAPSSVPGKSNGDVMVESAVKGFKATGRWLLNGNISGGGDQMAAETSVQNWAKNEQAQQDSAKNTNGTLPKPPRGTGSVPPQDRDPKRKFSPQERETKRDAQGGQCANGCGKTVDQSNSNGHHIDRHADGGKTEDKNHAEVCIDCHKELHSPPM